MGKWKGDPGCLIQRKASGQVVDASEIVEVKKEWKIGAVWENGERHRGRAEEAPLRCCLSSMGPMIYNSQWKWRSIGALGGLGKVKWW